MPDAGSCLQGAVLSFCGRLEVIGTLVSDGLWHRNKRVKKTATALIAAHRIRTPKGTQQGQQLSLQVLPNKFICIHPPSVECMRKGEGEAQMCLCTDGKGAGLWLTANVHYKARGSSNTFTTGEGAVAQNRSPLKRRGRSAAASMRVMYKRKSAAELLPTSREGTLP